MNKEMYTLANKKNNLMIGSYIGYSKGMTVQDAFSLFKEFVSLFNPNEIIPANKLKRLGNEDGMDNMFKRLFSSKFLVKSFTKSLQNDPVKTIGNVVKISNDRKNLDNLESALEYVLTSDRPLSQIMDSVTSISFSYLSIASSIVSLIALYISSEANFFLNTYMLMYAVSDTVYKTKRKFFGESFYNVYLRIKDIFYDSGVKTSGNLYTRISSRLNIFIDLLTKKIYKWSLYIRD